MSFAKEVWDTLSAVNVNNHVQVKQNLRYLSWPYAWSTLMQYYPESDYSYNELVRENDTVMVFCSVTVEKEGNKLIRSMHLPVMDYRNKPISNPTSVDINKSMMRCLVKCIAMFGLGLYIYAGEDLPEADTTKQAVEPKGFALDKNIVEKFNKYLNGESDIEFHGFFNSLSTEIQVELYNMAPNGQKTKHKQLIKTKDKSGSEQTIQYINTFVTAFDSNDSGAAYEAMFELSDIERAILMKQLSKNVKDFVETVFSENSNQEAV